jgi:hypothetical protein
MHSFYDSACAETSETSMVLVFAPWNDVCTVNVCPVNEQCNHVLLWSVWVCRVWLHLLHGHLSLSRRRAVCVVRRSTSRLNEWVSEWVSELSGWVAEWLNEWMNEWDSFIVRLLVDKCMSERVHEWVNVWMSASVRVSEWTSEDSLSESLIDRSMDCSMGGWRGSSSAAKFS